MRLFFTIIFLILLVLWTIALVYGMMDYIYSKRNPDLRYCDIKIPIICFVQVLIHIIILRFVNIFPMKRLFTIYLSCVAFYFLFLFLLNMIMFKFPTPNGEGGECWHFFVPFSVFFLLLMMIKLM